MSTLLHLYLMAVLSLYADIGSSSKVMTKSLTSQTTASFITDKTEMSKAMPTSLEMSNPYISPNSNESFFTSIITSDNATKLMSTIKSSEMSFLSTDKFTTSQIPVSTTPKNKGQDNSTNNGSFFF